MADEVVLEALDRLAIELVALTARALNESGGQAELTLAQWRALVIVASSEGMRPGDLAGRMGMSRPSTSRLLRRLVHKGLVIAAPDPDDGRAVTLWSAPQGRLILAGTRARRRRLLDEALSKHVGRLPGDLPHSLAALADTLAEYI